MSATEVVERFRKLSAEEQRQAFEQIRDEFEELSPELVAKFEKRAERLRQHPEKGIPWEEIRAEHKSRRRKDRACDAK